ncbi:hypothetical protein [Gordonia sputi]|uniref:hypothetical protein n=1 Tax=Gordonia sputi TaxID=36823 RepID=UPI00226F3CF4|nr:hypothetical protein [Gordonia sputi]
MSVETIPSSYPQFSVIYSNEDQEWVATSPNFPSLSWLAATPDDAVRGLERLIDEVRHDLQAEIAERQQVVQIMEQGRWH